jgi:hypothetical protein
MIIVPPRFIHQRFLPDPFDAPARLPTRVISETPRECKTGIWIPGEWEREGEWIWANGQCQIPPSAEAKYHPFHCTGDFVSHCTPGWWEVPPIPRFRLHHLATSLEEL